MKSSTFKIALAAAFAALATQASAAGTDTSQSITVNATVNTSCVVTSGTLGFGSYDPVNTNAVSGAGDLAGSTSFTLKCTKGAPVTVEMGAGSSFGLGPAVGGATMRAMRIGATSNYLSYELFQPVGFTPNPSGSAGTCPGTQAWIGNSSPGRFSFTSGSSATNTVNVCGSVQGGQDVGAGSYTDTVTMTVTF